MKKRLKIKLKSFTPKNSDQLILDNEVKSYEKEFEAIMKKHMGTLNIPYKKIDDKEKIEKIFSSFYFEK